jgi:hypothetical protein
MTINDADILAYVISFAVLGGLCILLGLFLRGRLEGLMVDPKLGEWQSEDEQDYRWSQLNTGVLTLLVVGTVLLFAALGLYIWGV